MDVLPGAKSIIIGEKAETDILTTRGTQGPVCLPMDQTQQPQLGPVLSLVS